MLVNKSIAIRPEVWRKLRINAELTGVSVRDYLTWIIERSQLVPSTDSISRAELRSVEEANRLAKTSSLTTPVSHG